MPRQDLEKQDPFHKKLSDPRDPDGPRTPIYAPSLQQWNKLTEISSQTLRQLWQRVATIRDEEDEEWQLAKRILCDGLALMANANERFAQRMKDLKMNANKDEFPVSPNAELFEERAVASFNEAFDQLAPKFRRSAYRDYMRVALHALMTNGSATITNNPPLIEGQVGLCDLYARNAVEREMRYIKGRK